MDNQFVLFGGGFDSAASNEIWKFSLGDVTSSGGPYTSSWTKIGGMYTLPGESGSVIGSNPFPSGRVLPAGAIDSVGNLVLFGG